MRFGLVAVVAVAACVLPAAVALGRSPTPLRLEARQALVLLSDGERYAIIEQRRRLQVIDSVTGARRRLGEPGCSATSVAEFMTHVAQGRAVLRCPDGPQVVDLATGARIALLPAQVTVDRTPRDALYTALGAWWVKSESAGACRSVGEFCHVYVNYRTGEQRVVPHRYVAGRILPAVRYDLDDPSLRAYRVCRPHRDLHPGGQRTYEPPFLLDDTVLRRCGRRGRVRSLPGDLPDEMNLSEGLVSWGDPWRDGDGRAYVYDTRRRRLHAWTIPTPARRRHASGRAVHTRTRVYIASTLSFNTWDEPDLIRVYSARIPGRG